MGGRKSALKPPGRKHRSSDHTRKVPSLRNQKGRLFTWVSAAAPRPCNTPTRHGLQTVSSLGCVGSHGARTYGWNRVKKQQRPPPENRTPQKSATTGNPQGEKVCRDHNNFGCRRNPCNFLHKCEKCGDTSGSHGRWDCPNK